MCNMWFCFMFRRFWAAFSSWILLVPSGYWRLYQLLRAVNSSTTNPILQRPFDRAHPSLAKQLCKCGCGVESLESGVISDQLFDHLARRVQDRVGPVREAALFDHLHLLPEPLLEVAQQVHNDLVLVLLIQVHVALQQVLHDLIPVLLGERTKPVNLIHVFLKG